MMLVFMTLVVGQATRLHAGNRAVYIVQTVTNDSLFWDGRICYDIQILLDFFVNTCPTWLCVQTRVQEHASVLRRTLARFESKRAEFHY